jgi:hypothetical protein
MGNNVKALWFSILLASLTSWSVDFLIIAMIESIFIVAARLNSFLDCFSWLVIEHIVD